MRLREVCEIDNAEPIRAGKETGAVSKASMLRARLSILEIFNYGSIIFGKMIIPSSPFVTHELV